MNRGAPLPLSMALMKMVLMSLSWRTAHVLMRLPTLKGTQNQVMVLRWRWYS